MNSAVSTYTSQFTSRNSPRATFNTVYAVNPIDSPLAMLNVSGMVTIVRNAGIATTVFDHGISATCDIISEPTMMSAGAVAAAGMAPTSGATNNATKNSRPVTIAVTPVRPPATTPAALSI